MLYESQETSVRAISDTTAFLMSTMLADVINAGTGNRARALGFTLPAAGKTGTTNDFNDAWFIGFTPKLVTGVWVGFDQPRTILPNGFAAEVAVPAWAKFMKAATRNDKPEWLAPPAGVTSAQGLPPVRAAGDRGLRRRRGRRHNGKLERRSMIYTEYFAKGTEPTAFCDQHPTRGIMTKLAGIFGGSDERPAPPHVEDTGVAPRQRPPRPSATGAAQAEMPPPPPPKKKRGFWSRLFGRDRRREQRRDARRRRRKRAARAGSCVSIRRCPSGTLSAHAG